MRRAVVVSLLAGAALSSAAGALAQQGAAEEKQADAAPRPNVVVFVLEGLRPDYLGVYGFERETAPNLARLADAGFVFERAVSTSASSVSAIASLMTSLYPHQHGVAAGLVSSAGRARGGSGARAVMDRLYGGAGDRPSAAARPAAEPVPVRVARLSAAVPLLAEQMKAAGYATFGLVADPDLGPEIGFDRGFDRFHRGPGASADELVAKLAEWRATLAASEPYFLFVCFTDPRPPHSRHPEFYLAPDYSSPAFATARAAAGTTPETAVRNRWSERADYLSEIGFVDAALGRVGRLLGLGDETLVAFVSDHGETFLDRPHARRLRSGLHGEVVRVLFALRGPALGVARGRSRLPVSLVDLAPTILELVGAAVPEGARGVSLAPLLGGGEAAEALQAQLRERSVFAGGPSGGRAAVRPGRGGGGAVWAVVRGAAKLILHGDGSAALYDLAKDPAEQTDLAASRPGLAKALEAAIAAERDDVGQASAEPVELELDGALAAELRALGYVLRPAWRPRERGTRPAPGAPGFEPRRPQGSRWPRGAARPTAVPSPTPAGEGGG